MKKIFESSLKGYYEHASKIYVYEPESDDELLEFEEMSFDERCDYIGVVDELGMEIMPGGKYRIYGFNVLCNHVVMEEIVTLNV